MIDSYITVQPGDNGRFVTKFGQFDDWVNYLVLLYENYHSLGSVGGPELIISYYT